MTLAELPFRKIWCGDFEFRAPDGERPDPLCMVARELRTGRLIRLWRDELHTLQESPFASGDDSLFVGYYTSAEFGCFLSLGWPMPFHVLDLCAEFKRTTSGLTVACGRSLLGALTYYGLDGIDTIEKESMRALAMRGGTYTDEERKSLLTYCQSDVDALEKLLPVMLERGDIDLPRALLRGRYMKSAAQIEWNGAPMDTDTLAKLRAGWTGIQDRLIADVDADYHVYDGRAFRADRWAQWLERNGVAWPRLESGALDLSRDAFHEMGRADSRIATIGELRHSLSELRLNDLAVGSDDRCRTLLGAFGSKTGRNQPSNSKSIFGPATWLRGLIKPVAGRAVAYVDWSMQEFGIAAALSGDEAMQRAYASGDPYLEFARQAGAVPLDATRQTHHAERERFKVVCLAVSYGMGEDSLARRLSESPARARELLRLHRETYPRYWQWSDAVECRAMLFSELRATFGWTVHVGPDANPRSLRNFPLQANGAEMLRLACILATEAGVTICAPVHDALLIEADTEEIEAAVADCQRFMQVASEIVLAGFPLRADAKIVRHPNRFSDPRGKRMWETVNRLIESENLMLRPCNIRCCAGAPPVQSNTLISLRSIEDPPHGPLRPAPILGADADANPTKQETAPAQIRPEVFEGSDSVGVAEACSLVAGSGAIGVADAVARGRLSEPKDGDILCESGAVDGHQPARGTACNSEFGICWPDFGGAENRPRFAGDDSYVLTDEQIDVLEREGMVMF